MIASIINQAKEIYAVLTLMTDERIKQEMELFNKIGSVLTWHKIDKAEIMAFATANRAGFSACDLSRRDKMDIYAAMHFISTEAIKARAQFHKTPDAVRAMNFYEGARLADNYHEGY